MRKNPPFYEDSREVVLNVIGPDNDPQAVTSEQDIEHNITGKRYLRGTRAVSLHQCQRRIARVISADRS